MGYAPGMTRQITTLVLALGLGSATVFATQSAWLPAGAEEQMAEQLASRLAAIEDLAPEQSGKFIAGRARWCGASWRSSTPSE